MKPDTLRANLDPSFFDAADDLHGVVIGFAVWLVIMLAAPLVVLVLAAGLLSVELPIVVVLAVVFVVVRFTGLMPWEVLIVDLVSGEERRERYRFLWRALRRIREVNNGRRVKVSVGRGLEGSSPLDDGQGLVGDPRASHAGTRRSDARVRGVGTTPHHHPEDAAS